MSGEELRRLRESAGMTQREVCAELEVSQPHWCDMENDRKAVRKVTLLALRWMILQRRLQGHKLRALTGGDIG